MSLPNQILEAEEAEFQVTRSILDLEMSNNNKEEYKTAAPIQGRRNVWSDYEQMTIVQKLEYPDFKIRRVSIELADSQYNGDIETHQNCLVLPNVNVNSENMVKNEPIQAGTGETTNQPSKPSRGDFESKPMSLLSIPDDEFCVGKLKQQNQSLNSLILGGSEVGSTAPTKITLDKPFENENSQNGIRNQEAFDVIPQQRSEGSATQPSTNPEATCRICLDNEQNIETGNFIKPCRCTGTMEWVHDECLKTWIVAKENEINAAACELCGTSFNMRFKLENVFYPRKAFKEKVFGLMSCICLSFTIMALLIIITVLAVGWSKSINEEEGTAAQQSSAEYKLSLIVVCALISGIVSVFVFLVVRDICFRTEVSEWIILPYDPTQFPQEIENSPSNVEDNSEGSRDRGDILESGLDSMSAQEQTHAEARIQQISGSSMSGGDVKLHQAAPSNTSFLDQMDASLEVSQCKDLNISNMSEGVPLKIVSRLKNRVLPVQNHPYSASKSQVLEIGSNKLDNLTNNAMAPEKQQFTFNQSGDSQTDPTILVKSATYSSFSKSNALPKAHSFRPSTAQSQRTEPILLLTKIPKEFLTTDSQQNKIEVVVNATNPKCFNSEDR